MANWSDTSIELKGVQAKEAHEYINSLCEDGGIDFTNVPKGLDKEFGYTFFSEVEIDGTFDEKEDDNSLTLYGQGRWSGPYNFIKDVVKKFGLSGTYVDMEAGSDFFHKITFKDGEVIEEIEDEYFCKASVEHINDLEYCIDHYQGCFSGDSDGLDIKIKEFKLFFPNDINDEKEKEIRKRLSED